MFKRQRRLTNAWSSPREYYQDTIFNDSKIPYMYKFPCNSVYYKSIVDIALKELDISKFPGRAAIVKKMRLLETLSLENTKNLIEKYILHG